MKDIDFVILWVDGNDPKWLEEKSKYTPSKSTDNRIQRYRDWDNLQYIFRGIENCTPWVRKIHLVTWGHLPKWINVNHPKLNIVNHKDFMPQEALPTFNCNPLELNLHRIPGLAEQFVYFNDDTFIIDKMKESDFFKNGLPCDTAVLNVHCYSEAVQFHFGYERAMGIINKYFDFHTSIRKNLWKWFNYRYGLKQLRTFILLGCPRFPGLWQHHAPASYLKKTYGELWEKEGNELMETTLHKFRHKLDLTQASLKAWQIAKGEFYPRRASISASFMIQNGYNNPKKIAKFIENRKYKMITVNDGEMTNEEFDLSKRIINTAFEKIYPHKSSFEK